MQCLLQTAMLRKLEWQRGKVEITRFDMTTVYSRTACRSYF